MKEQNHKSKSNIKQIKNQKEHSSKEWKFQSNKSNPIEKALCM
jgi:hypothetical protein